MNAITIWGRPTVVSQASRLASVRYDIRGPVLARARQLEAQGHEIIKLNIGNPAPFGLFTPDAVLSQVTASIADSQGYSDARGIAPAREAVARYFGAKLGVTGVTPDDVYLGNGVSELIVMALQALLNPGDEVLVPSPDYPLWTGAVNLGGGRAVHYRCAEDLDWNPDVAHVESLITSRTRALVIINPNNPTGAVYSRETLLGLLEVARRHELLVLSDEIYDQILFDGAVHYSAAALAPDLPVLTLGGMSKTYRLAGFRSGWLVVSGPREPVVEYREGLELLANMRMCPNVPAQHAIPAALDGGIDITPLLLPGGRLRDQRDAAWAQLTAIPGVDCYKPAGALYLFPRLDPEVHKVVDDERMCIDLLEQQHLLLTHGTGFNLPSTDHIRVVFLAPVEVLSDAITRLGEFLATYRQ
ncbi:MAG TPA: pyridoxal phosphate-dependent aminotransferase [Trebonia sp.]|jgi:alanine-synthesizing transaminase|nr:pyridoxal phosphate-dependent aminotransferase [Trebonia sp.]